MSASPQPEDTIPAETGVTSSLGAGDIPGFEATEALLPDAVAEAGEESTPRQRLAFPPRPENPPSTLVPTVHAEESGSENEDDGLGHLAAEDSGSGSESDNDAEEAYAPEEGSQKKKQKSRKSGEKKERKKKEKRAERPVEEVEDEDMEPTYDEATQRRLALEQRIDAIGKPERKIKRKRKDEEDVADMYHEDVCNRLRERMERAAEKDRSSHEKKLPATAKLAMLEDVMAVLRNVRMWQAIVDSRLLEAVSTWLEPIRPSGTLPAEGIQKAFFEVLPRMEIDAQTLKESYLGRVVLFYTKAPKVQGPIKRQADNLVQAWSRPILGRSSDMRNRKVLNIKDLDLTAAAEDLDAGNGDESTQGQSQSQSQSQARSQGQKQRKKRVDWNERAEINTTAKGARLEKASDFQYEIAPESMHKGNDRERDEHMRRIQMDNSRFNKFARQMRGGKAAR